MESPRSKGSSADLNDVFPLKACINLDRRTDRWQQMQLKFDRHAIKGVRRFSAVDGQNLIVPPIWSDTAGAYGCLLSHLAVVREARELGASSVLIFEDDVAFAEGLQDSFGGYFAQVPPRWEMLYFGALHLEEPLKISENVCRVRRANSTFAYALRQTIFDDFIELTSNADTPVDVSNRLLQTRHACYCFIPHLAWVEDDCSDVQVREKFHWYLRESLVIHGAGMDRLLRQTSVIIAYTNPTGKAGIKENLIFLTRFYTERLGLNVIIVEQGSESGINLEDFPKGCKRFLVRAAGPFDKGCCFNNGMMIAPSDHAFLIFSDSDIFVEEWDIRGQLRMCERYDGTTGFGTMVELTDQATLNLRSNRPMLLTPWFDATDYLRTKKSGVIGQFCVFNRSSIEAAGGWEEGGGNRADVAPVPKEKRRMRVFESPNDALRLYHD